jgi:hypothetical protein
MSSGHHIVGSMAKGLRIVIALLLFAASPLGSAPAWAGGGTGAAAAVGSAGLDACRTTSGKVLYDCVAGVLDRMSGTLTRSAQPGAREALQSAASQLRAASNKAQALSAIAQCRSAFAGLIQQAKAARGEAPGLTAIVGVLSKAAALIQSKG